MAEQPAMDPLDARRTLPAPAVAMTAVTPTYRGRGGPFGAKASFEQQQPTASTHFIAQVHFLFLDPNDADAAAAAKAGRPASAATVAAEPDGDVDDGAEAVGPQPSLPSVVVRAPATASVRQFVDLALKKLADEVDRISDASLPGNPVADLPAAGSDGPATPAEAAGARAAALAAIDPPSVALEDFTLHLGRPDGSGIAGAVPAARPLMTRLMSGTMRPSASASASLRQRAQLIPPSPFEQPSQVLLQHPKVAFPYTFVVASAGVDYSAVTAAAGRGAKAVLTDDRLDPSVALVQPGRTRLPHLVELKKSAGPRAQKVTALAEAKAAKQRAAAAEREQRERDAAAITNAGSRQTTAGGGGGGEDSPPSPGCSGLHKRAGTRSAALAERARRASSPMASPVLPMRSGTGSAFDGAGASLRRGTAPSIMSGRSTAGTTAAGPRVARSGPLAHMFVADDDTIMSALGLSAYDVARYSDGQPAADAARACAAAGPQLEQMEIDRRRSEAVATRERRLRQGDTQRAQECVEVTKRIAAERQAEQESQARREAQTTLEAARARAEQDVAAAQRVHTKSRAEAALRAEIQASAVGTSGVGSSAANRTAFGGSTLIDPSVPPAGVLTTERAKAIAGAVDESVLAKERQRDAQLHPTVTFAGPLLAALHAGNAAKALRDEAALRRREALLNLQSSLDEACGEERAAAEEQAARDEERRHARASEQDHTDTVKVAEGRRAGAKRVEREARRTEAERLQQLHESRSWAALAESRLRRGR